jgi:menaquinone-dependent protoporphyrinogen IX oxidase
MKSIVIYKSKTGFSKKYADWIAEELKADIFKTNEVNLEMVMKYDNIIYLGGLYVGGILGFSFIKNNFNKLKDKNIIAIAVGATTKKDEAIEEVKNRNLNEEMRDKVDFFLLRGGLDYKKMNLLDRFLMFLLVKSIKSKKQEELNDEQIGMISTYGKTVDFTNKKYIEPIIQVINSKVK